VQHARALLYTCEELHASGDDASDTWVAFAKAGLRFRVSQAQRDAAMAAWGTTDYSLDLRGQCGALCRPAGAGACRDPWYRP